MFPYINDWNAWILFLQCGFYFIVAGIIVWSFLYLVCREPCRLVYRTMHIVVSITGIVLGFNYFFLN
jgi:hypothetical protein